MIAVENSNLDIAEYLVSKGIDVDMASSYGVTALMAAAEKGHVSLIPSLCTKSNVNFQTKFDGKTALMFAAESGYSAICEVLLARSANVNLKDERSWTAVVYATHGEHSTTVELLANKGARLEEMAVVPNKEIRTGWTCLMLAAVSASTDAVDVLLKAKANPDTMQEDSRSALMHAAAVNNTDAIQLLVDRCCQLDLQNRHKWTALMCAASRGHLTAVQQLVQHGANVDLQTEAVPTLWAIIENKQSDWQTYVHKTTRQTVTSEPREYLDYQSAGETALALATKHGHAEVVAFLAGCSSKPAKQHNPGQTTAQEQEGTQLCDPPHDPQNSQSSVDLEAAEQTGPIEYTGTVKPSSCSKTPDATASATAPSVAATTSTAPASAFPTATTSAANKTAAPALVACNFTAAATATATASSNSSTTNTNTQVPSFHDPAVTTQNKEKSAHAQPNKKNPEVRAVTSTTKVDGGCRACTLL